jgi:hypothetical protein
MSDRRIRTLLVVLCVLGVAAARAIATGRRRSTSHISRHPSVDDGRGPLAPAPAPLAVSTPVPARVFEAPLASVAALPEALEPPPASVADLPEPAEPPEPASGATAPIASGAPPQLDGDRRDHDDATTAPPRSLAPEPTSLAPERASQPVPATDQPWAAPVGGTCPEGYPVKAKLRSGIYHLPGMSAYERTTPDRCYPTADAAVADGLRPAKR